MKRILFQIIASVIILSSCKKEGLSKNTGNVEITVPGGPDFYEQWHYEIFTEEQYDKYINALPYFALREGNSKNGKIYETGILQGNYVLKTMPVRGGRVIKHFQVVANKINKYSIL
jgi:hypothetical protein